MKKYNFRLFIRITFVIALAITEGIVLSIQIYWVAIFIFLGLIWSVYHLYCFLKRTNQDTQRLINAIRFSESNITFQSFEKKGLPHELAVQMEESVSQFNKKLLQIETEQQFYDNLLNRIDAGILVMNKTGNIEWINKAALDEFGKPQPRKIQDLKSISPELPLLLESILPKETKTIKIQHEHSFRQLAITAVLFTAKGKELKLISIKNIESVVEESESDAWKKLIRVLTHEMMNSITPIISLSESLSENIHGNDRNPELMERAIKTIHRRSKGLVEFVQNYQKLTRIPNPLLNIIPAKEMMDDISGLLMADGIRFSYTLFHTDTQWKVDRAQMEQVLINLIKNAWEACQEISKPDIQIDITENEYRQPIIAISDNGCGILPEVLDKIFVPFFTTKQGGSGIGLSICRQIVNAHGGTLSVISEIGKGSCFTIRL